MVSKFHLVDLAGTSFSAPRFWVLLVLSLPTSSSLILLHFALDTPRLFLLRLRQTFLALTLTTRGVGAGGACPGRGGGVSCAGSERAKRTKAEGQVRV